MGKQRNEGDDRQAALIYLAIIAALGLFYTGISYHAHQSFTERRGGWYGELAQAFLQGKVSLLSQPSAGLLADPRPYAGIRDYPIKPDISYYHGKYYLYFGPTPAVLFFLPWQVLTGHVLNEALTFWTLCMIGLILFSLILHAIVRLYFPDASLWLQGLILILFGLGNCQGYIIHFVQMYGLACMTAAVMVTAMFYLIFLVLHQKKAQTPLLMVAGACWGAAVGARADTLFYGIVFPVLFYYLSREWPRARLLQAALASCVAPLAIGLALLWYNYARFGHPLDFGYNYQIVDGADYTAQPRFSLKYLPFGLLDYLLMPWRPSTDFPFLFPEPPRFRVFDPSGLAERYLGLLFATPILAYGALWPRVVHPARLRCFALLLTLGGMAVLAVLACHIFVQYHYFLDFLTPFFLLMAISLLACEKALAENFASRCVFWTVAIYSLYLGLALSAVGQINGIHTFQTYPPPLSGEPWLPDAEVTVPPDGLKN